MLVNSYVINTDIMGLAKQKILSCLCEPVHSFPDKTGKGQFHLSNPESSQIPFCDTWADQLIP